MYGIKEKIESGRNTRRSENSFSRLFRSTTGFHASLISLERTDQEDADNDSQKEIRHAMLETEHKKAKAIMAWQQHQYSY